MSIVNDISRVDRHDNHGLCMRQKISEIIFNEGVTYIDTNMRQGHITIASFAEHFLELKVKYSEAAHCLEVDIRFHK